MRVSSQKPIQLARLASAASPSPVTRLFRAIDHLEPLPVLAIFALCLGPLLAQLARLRESELSELIASAFAVVCLMTLGTTVLLRRQPILLSGRLLPMTLFWAALTLLHVSLYEDVRVIKYVAFFMFSTALPVLLTASVGSASAVIIVLRCVFVATLPFIVGSLFVPEMLYVSHNSYYTPARCGWFHNPNTYGTVAFVLGATAVTLLSDDVRRIGALRLTYVAVAAVSLLAIWNSRSRAAALALAAFILVYLILQLKMRWKSRNERMGLVISMILAVLCSSVFLVLVGADIFTRVEVQEFIIKRGRSTDLSSGRLEMWQSAIYEWYRADSTLAALLGYGLGSSTELAAVAEFGSLHNSYIKALFESGLIGAMVLVGYTVALLLLFASRAFKDGHDAGMFALFVAIAVHSMFEAHLFNFGTTLSSVIFWSALTRINRKAIETRCAC